MPFGPEPSRVFHFLKAINNSSLKILAAPIGLSLLLILSLPGRSPLGGRRSLLVLLIVSVNKISYTSQFISRLLMHRRPPGGFWLLSKTSLLIPSYKLKQFLNLIEMLVHCALIILLVSSSS